MKHTNALSAKNTNLMTVKAHGSHFFYNDLNANKKLCCLQLIIRNILLKFLRNYRSHPLKRSFVSYSWIPTNCRWFQIAFSDRLQLVTQYVHTHNRKEYFQLQWNRDGKMITNDDWLRIWKELMMENYKVQFWHLLEENCLKCVYLIYSNDAPCWRAIC
jgi:hypothetical protein